MALQTLAAKRTGASRHDRMAGRDYLVVPMIMITEGVHEGSNGPLFYPAAELKKTPAVWNMKPIVVYHPQSGSACDPLVYEKHGVGVIMNTKFKQGKLHAEAWLEVDRLAAVDERVLQAIEADETMEVSTGLFTDNEQKEGEWNGEAYDAIARNYRPDHLAILPDQKGACSIADGAGLLRTNSSGKPLPHYILSNAVEEVLSRFTANAAASFSTISSAVSQALREALGEKWHGWTEDVYPDYVIYWNDGTLFQQDYHFKDTTATLVGDPVEVKRVTKYVKVGETQNAAPNNGEIAMTKNEIVSHLITNAGWKEEDRAVLMAMSDDQLGRIHKPTINTAAPAATPTPTPAPTPAPTATPVANAAPAVTFEQLLESAPAAMREAIAEGMTANAAERQTLITAITANSTVFTAEELAQRPTAELRKLATLARPAAPAPTDYRLPPMYAGAAAPFVANTNPTANGGVKEEPLLLPTMNFDK